MSAMADDQEKPVLTIPNFHIAGCGEPPDLKTGNRYYTAYFENEHGEQLIFQYNYSIERGFLWHGDYSWEKPVEVMKGTTSLLTMAREEDQWLRLVWHIARRRQCPPDSVAESDKTIELKKPVCPYCGQPLELDIRTFYMWYIRADCKACGNEIDFGYKPPDNTPKRVKCLACEKEFWNTDFITGNQGAHCPFCGKHKWEFVKQLDDSKISKPKTQR